MPSFTCPRTCRFTAHDLCRFQPLFLALHHPHLVTSHTTTIAVQFKNRDALTRAAARLKATILGDGQHRLYQGTTQGFGIKLPNWRFPIVLNEDGLHYDAYNGRWGNPNDLDRLKRIYTIECAKLAAEHEGWYYEEHDDHLTIYHPDGGTMTVSADGTVDASGFCGQDCHAAEPIERALGRPIETTFKPEYYLRRAQISLPDP